MLAVLLGSLFFQPLYPKVTIREIQADVETVVGSELADTGKVDGMANSVNV